WLVALDVEGHRLLKLLPFVDQTEFGPSRRDRIGCVEGVIGGGHGNQGRASGRVCARLLLTSSPGDGQCEYRHQWGGGGVVCGHGSPPYALKFYSGGGGQYDAEQNAATINIQPSLRP